MEPAVGAWCTGTSICFRLRDHERRLTSVRMSSGVLPPADFTYVPEQQVWELRRPCPAVWRIEYRYELRYADGSGGTGPDPGNPRRAGGAAEPGCPGHPEARGRRVRAALPRLPGMGVPAGAVGRRVVAGGLPADAARARRDGGPHLVAGRGHRPGAGRARRTRVPAAGRPAAVRRGDG